MGVRLLPGTRIRGYRVLKCFATGGEGDIYLAEGPDGTKVALKQYSFSVSAPEHAESRERVKRLKTLIGKHSPYVCAIYEVFEHNDLAYVAMEYVEGISLDAVIARKGRLDWSVWKSIARDVLQGLAWLHSQDIVHRDVKPANIILTKGPARSQAKLVDLGIVFHRALPRLTSKLAITATPAYAPPEMLLGGEGEIDERSDLYCLSATSFHVLTGHLPFPDAGWPLRREFIERLCDPERPSMRALVPDIPEFLDKYVQRLMSVRKEDRPANAAEAWDELQAVVMPGSRSTVETPKHEAAIPSSRAVPRDTDSPCAVGEMPTSPAAGCGLRIASGPRMGAVLSIPKGGIALGRASLNPGDAGISRFHVRVKPTKHGLTLRDLGSLNGLIYRDRRVRRAVLQPGEEVLIGSTALVCTT